MKSYKEFKEKYKNIEEYKLKKIYKKYKENNFNSWLSQYSAEEINRVGLDIYLKIFEAMYEDYK